MSAAVREPTHAELALLKALGFSHVEHLGWLHPDGAQVSDDGSFREAIEEAYAVVEHDEFRSVAELEGLLIEVIA